MPKNTAPRFPGIDALTLRDLELWAGETILSRGRDYQRRGLVSDLAITRDDMLLATVQGGEVYAVVVMPGEDGLPPDSICTCPCDFTCKHAVAALLEYLDRLKKGKAVPTAAPDDPRLALLEAEDWWFADADEDEDEDEDEEAAASAPRETTRRGRAAPLAERLEGLDKERLVALMLDLVEEVPDLRRHLEAMLAGLRGDASPLLEALRKEIARQTVIDPWYSHWSGDGNLPDYTGVRRAMKGLLATGKHDEALVAGADLVRLGLQQIERSDDEGASADDLAQCMPLLAQALRGSRRPLADRLLWAVDALLADDFGVCDGLAQFLDEAHPARDWSALADILKARLDAMNPGGEHPSYARRRLVDWLVRALERAGRQAEILPLCEAEARLNGDHERLIARLVDEGRDEEALGRIREGIGQAASQRLFGTVSSLRDHARRIYRRRGERRSLIPLEAAEFVRYPEPEAFERCRRATEVGRDAPDGLWNRLRRALLEFLVSGKLPWEHPDWPADADKPDPAQAERGVAKFPQVESLLELAIHEKNADDVLRWLPLQPKGLFGSDSVQDRAATVLRERFPDQALAIWKELAERNVALAKKRSYQAAVGYLRKAQDLLARGRNKGWKKEWTSYLSDLRTQHRRKRLFLEELGRLDDTPLLRQ